MNTFGSPSWALQITYLGVRRALRAPAHLIPAGKPAPPRPRKFESVIVLMIASGFMPPSTSRSIW